MKGTLFAFLATFVVVISLLREFLDIWIRQSEREKLRDRVTTLWYAHTSSSPALMSRAPLLFARAALNRVFGKGLLSRKAFLRSTLVGSLLLFVGLAAGGLRSGTVFGITEWPWEKLKAAVHHWQQYADGIDQELHTTTVLAPAETTSLQVRSEVIPMLRSASRLQTQGWLIAYTVTCALVVLVWNALAGYFMLVLVRKFIDHLLLTDSAFLQFAVVLTDTVIATVVVGSGLVAMSVLLSPSLWLLVYMFPEWPGGIPLDLVAGGAAVWALGAWYLGEAPLKAIVIVAAWPCIVTIGPLIASGFIHFMRRPAHEFVGSLLLRAAEGEGPGKQLPRERICGIALATTAQR